MNRPPREELTFRRKQEDESFLVNFPLGVRDWAFQLPKGLIKGQSLEMLLRRLTLPVATTDSFDNLPTPFRAVATDLATGDPVVIKNGDLASAMRASLSVPGLFVPVERGGQVLGGRRPCRQYARGRGARDGRGRPDCRGCRGAHCLRAIG
ncbi:MAG: patatin-like phospholipase family protein [Steroidobacteraceae bacterium]